MRKFNKIVFCLGLIVLLLAGSLAGCGSDKVVAEVGPDKIAKSEFDKTFNIYKTSYESSMGPDVWEQEVDGKKFADVAKEKTLQMMIDVKLQAQKVQALGIYPTTEELKAEMDAAKQMYGGEEKFNTFLQQNKITMAFFTQMVKEELINRKLTDKTNETITVSDAEVKTEYDKDPSAYDQVKASHILVNTEEEAKKVAERVAKGEDFATLAKELSIESAAKESGGELGYFSRADMVPEFSAAAFALKVGEVSAPVQTQHGFHIIKCEEIKKSTFEASKEGVKSKILDQKQQEAYIALMAQLNKDGNIKKYPENL